MSKTKTILEPGDILARDLLHPQTLQILLPSGTVLTDSYIFKIELMRLTMTALESLKPPDEPGAMADKEPASGPMDHELFLKAKGVMVKLEELAKSHAGGKEAKTFDSFSIREMLNDLIQSMLQRLEVVVPGSYPDLRATDYYLYAHPINVTMMALSIGLALKYDRTRLYSLGCGALLADLGKFCIPRALLHKTEPLSPADHGAIREHIARGLEVVTHFKWVREAIYFVMENHHERFDGTGYPKGLRGPQIGEEAQIVGLADTYDAMISDVPHRKRLDPSIAYRLIQSQSGKEWDPGVVWGFQRFIAPYPVNSMVKLNTGEEARVVAVRPSNLYKPIVAIMETEFDLSTDKERRIVAAVARRKYHREKISLAVEVRVEGRDVFHGHLTDLSLNGLSLTGSIEGKPGMELDVTIPLPAQRASIEIKGTVIWSRPLDKGGFQMGLAFKQISATNKDKLLEAIWGVSQSLNQR